MSPQMRLNLSGLHAQNNTSSVEFTDIIQHADTISTRLSNVTSVKVNEDQIKLQSQPLHHTTLHVIYPGQLLRAGRAAVPVAVKCYSTSRDEVSRFVNEVQLLWALHHPNIVKLWAWTCTSKSCMCAIDLAKCSLQDLLASSEQGGRLNAATKLTIAAQLADALRYLHKRGLHHDRLCPSHVLLGTSDGFCKLTSLSQHAASANQGAMTTTTQQNGATSHTAATQDTDKAALDDINSFGKLLTDLFSVHDAPQVIGGIRNVKEQAGRQSFKSQSQNGPSDPVVSLRRSESLRRESLRARVATHPHPVDTTSQPPQQPWIPLSIKRIVSRCTDPDVSKRMKMPEVLRALAAVPEQVESDIQALSASLRSGVQAELQQTIRQLHSYVLDGWCDPCIPLHSLLSPSTDAAPFTPRTARNVGPTGPASTASGAPFGTRNCMWGRIIEAVLSLACSSPAVPVVQACVSLLLCYTQASHQHCKALTHKGGLRALLHLLEAHSNVLVRATSLQATIVVMQAWVQSGAAARGSSTNLDSPGSAESSGMPLRRSSERLAGDKSFFAGDKSLLAGNVGGSSMPHGNSNGVGSGQLKSSASAPLPSNGSAALAMQHSGGVSLGSAASMQLPPAGALSNRLSLDCAGASVCLDSKWRGVNGVLSRTLSGGSGEECGGHGPWPASPLQVLLPNMHWLVPMMQDLDAKVRSNACTLVRLLAASDDRTRAALVQNGAVTFLDALLQDPPVEQIHLNATAALLLLAGSNSILGAISEAKATVPTLIKLLKQAADVELAVQVAAVLAALARNGMGSAITACEPAIPTVLHLIKQPAGRVDPRILAYLAEMLGGVASNVSAKAMLVKAGLVPPLVLLLQHPSADVVRQVARALVRLAFDFPEPGQVPGDPVSPQPSTQFKPGREVVDAGAVLACLHCHQYRSLVAYEDAAATLVHVITTNPTTSPSIMPVAIDRLTFLAELNTHTTDPAWTSIFSPAVPPLLSQLKSALPQTATPTQALAGLICCCLQCLAVNPELQLAIASSPGVVGLLGSKLHALVKDLEKRVAAGGAMLPDGSGRMTPSPHPSPRPSPRASPREPPGGLWPEEDVAFDIVCCLWSLAWSNAKVQLELLDAGAHLDVFALLRLGRGRSRLLTACVFYLGCFIVERSSRVRLKASSVEESLVGLGLRHSHPRTAQLAKALVQAAKEGDTKEAVSLLFAPLPGQVQEWIAADKVIV